MTESTSQKPFYSYIIKEIHVGKPTDLQNRETKTKDEHKREVPKSYPQNEVVRGSLPNNKQ